MASLTEVMNAENSENEGILAQQARDAAATGNLAAMQYIQSMGSPENSSDAKLANQRVPNGLQGGSQPIGASTINSSPQQPQTLSLAQVAQSVLKRNPGLQSNPNAFLQALETLKPIIAPSDKAQLDRMKFQFEQQKYFDAPNQAKVVSAAKEAGKNMGDNKQVSLGAKDVLNTYDNLKSDAAKAPSGAIESGLASAANYLNIPTEGSTSQGTFDADLNNLFLATVRTLKGTGRVMKAELDNIAGAAPKRTDSTAVKMAKIDAHMKYYRQRMQELGYDPDSGDQVSDTSQSPSSSPNQENSQQTSRPSAQPKTINFSDLPE